MYVVVLEVFFVFVFKRDSIGITTQVCLVAIFGNLWYAMPITFQKWL